MKIGGYQILDVYNYTFTVGTGVKVDGSYKLIKAMRGKPINTSRIKIGAVTYDAAYLAFIPDGTSFKATFGDKTITIAADDTITFTNGIIGGGGGGGTQVQANWTEEDTSDPSYIQNKPELAEVATSGDYDDLENKPAIPAAQVQADWDETDVDDPSYIKNKPIIPSANVQKYNTTSLKTMTDTVPDFVEWSLKTWNPLPADMVGANIWTDGKNIYYSSGTTQYVLEGSTWTQKVWTGLTSFSGASIWTDGVNIYYSASTNQYVLDIATSSWTSKTWTGLTSFSGASIWTDGVNIYYSASTNQYVLDVSTSTWSEKSWIYPPEISIQGDRVWNDGTDIYYSSTSDGNFVLDIATSTWTRKVWTGLTSFTGANIWTDGVNIYYSASTNQYVLDIATSTWTPKTWTGITSFGGNQIWTDGADIYYSNGANQYKLNRR